MKLTSKFEKALQYTARIHSKQKRKSTTIPYISHLLGVASIALEYGANEDEAIGALLHDAGEDAGGQKRINDIAKRFGKKAAAIVQGCTDTVENPKPDWLTRKKKYIAHIPKASKSVQLVSACDKLHNAGSICAIIKLSVKNFGIVLPPKKMAHFGITVNLSKPSGEQSLISLLSTSSIASFLTSKSSAPEAESRG